MKHSTSHLRPDGTTFPPVTPDPPPPPGWVDPLESVETGLEDPAPDADETSTSGGEDRTGPGA